MRPTCGFGIAECPRRVDVVWNALRTWLRLRGSNPALLLAVGKHFTALKRSSEGC
jgi:hypothetical protein